MGRGTAFLGRLNFVGVCLFYFIFYFLQIKVKIELEVITVFIFWKLIKILNYLPFLVSVCVTGFDAQRIYGTKLLSRKKHIRSREM